MNRYVSEAIGTFLLVFVGCGAIVVNDLSNGSITHVGISIAFGLVVMAMIYSVGEISGAHLNPAVTVGFWLARRFPLMQVFPYIGAQLVGAVAASALLRWFFVEHGTLGATIPAGSTRSASSKVRVKGFSSRRRTIARAMRPAWRSSP